MSHDDTRLLLKAREDIRYALADLCDPLKRTIWREDGTLTRHHAVSLLKQLREEVGNSSGRSGGRRRAYSSLATYAQAVESVIADPEFASAGATKQQVASKDPQVGFLAKWIKWLFGRTG